MSANILSVIPTDPRWQPATGAADRAVSLATRLAPASPGDPETRIKAKWLDTVTFVDCGENLERINCPECGRVIENEHWVKQMDLRFESGFEDLTLSVPCCGAQTTLDALVYEGPCGFARFEISIWEPGRDRFTDDELAALAEALGHSVRQVMAHI